VALENYWGGKKRLAVGVCKGERVKNLKQKCLKQKRKLTRILNHTWNIVVQRK